MPTTLSQKIQQKADDYQEVRFVKAQSAYYRTSFLQDDHFIWPEESYPLEKNRYLLIWLPACPRAQRVAATIDLLGLTDWIEKIELAPYREKIWHFKEKFEDAYYLDELFAEQKDAVQPCLYDKKRGEIVTNDQYNLSTLLLQFCRKLAKPTTRNLHPEEIKSQVDQMNGFIFKHVNVQIYRARNAKNQEDKIEEEAKLAQTFQLLDEHLAHYRFLLGDTLTDADLRLFASLLRCPIYYKQFALNCCQLNSYKNLWHYTQEIYKIPDIQKTAKLEQIVETHYRSPHNLEKFGSFYQDETVESTYGNLLEIKREY